MATSELWSALGTEIVVMSNTDLSALASAALFLSTGTSTGIVAGVIDNTQLTGSLGDVYCRVTATLTQAVAGTVNTGYSIWFLKSQDGGTTFESGATGYTPLRMPDLVIPAPVDTTQRIVMRDVIAPAGKLKMLILNGSGQALKTDTTSTGSKLTITPFARQSV